MSGPPDAATVSGHLRALQDEICSGLERVDGSARFRSDVFERPGGGQSRSHVLEDGPVVERAAVNFTHTSGRDLPPAATARRPELAGRGYEAVSVSLIVHPRNPYAPTSHANFRYFVATRPDAAPIAWFGGGFDLTPFYGFDEDVVHWHRTARAACEPFGDHVYPRFKRWCDEYFYLPHRGEARGVGGLFFDDLDPSLMEAGPRTWDECYGLWRSTSEHYLPAYLPLLERRKDSPFGDREREFQLLRRGRYVEFNLVYDRGTLFGLQSGARTESVLASMPPRVRWSYDWHAEPGSPEAELVERFLPARDWLGEEAPGRG